MDKHFSKGVISLAHQSIPKLTDYELDKIVILEFDSSFLLIKSNHQFIIDLVNQSFLSSKKTSSNKIDRIIEVFFVPEKNEIYFLSKERKVICRWDEVNLYFVVRDRCDFLVQAGSWNKYRSNPKISDKFNFKLLSYFLEREIIIGFYRSDEYVFFHGVFLQKSHQNLILLGNSGVGKSTIAHCLKMFDWKIKCDDIVAFAKDSSEFVFFPKKQEVELAVDEAFAHFNENEVDVRANRAIFIEYNSNLENNCELIKVSLQEGLSLLAKHLILKKSNQKGYNLVGLCLHIFVHYDFFVLKTNHCSLEESVKTIIYAK